MLGIGIEVTFFVLESELKSGHRYWNRNSKMLESAHHWFGLDVRAINAAIGGFIIYCWLSPPVPMHGGLICIAFRLSAHVFQSSTQDLLD